MRLAYLSMICPCNGTDADLAEIADDSNTGPFGKVKAFVATSAQSRRSAYAANSCASAEQRAELADLLTYCGGLDG